MRISSATGLNPSQVDWLTQPKTCHFLDLMLRKLIVTAAMLFTYVAGPAYAQATRDTTANSNSNSPWGVAPSATLSNNPGAWLPAMAEAGVGSVRSLYAPSASEQDRLAPMTGAGMSGVGILKWSTGATSTFPVDDLTGWRNYVTSQVTKYKGRITQWEVWNEPPNFTVDKSPSSYAAVVAAAYDAAKAVDPGVQIGLAAKSNHVNWLAESIAAGAKDKFDFVTLHPYEVAAKLPLGWEGQFMGIVPGVRQMLRAMNPAKADVPVMFTEVGIPASPPASGGVGPAIQADVLTKIYTMALAQGVTRTFWFDPRDSEGLSLGLTTSDGARRPAWYALRSLTTYLGATPVYAGWIQPDNAFYGFVFTSEKGVVLVAWSRASQSSMRLLSSDITAVDPRTGAATVTRTPHITDAPIILAAPAGSAQAGEWLAEADANRDKAFSWNGDHSAATSVRLVAGETPAGVFMVNPPAVTVVNGIAEFNFAGRGSARFAVDPTFVSFATTPVRITAVVRGQGTGSPGFNLKYESDVPIASADENGLVSLSSGWFQVKGTEFYEKTWVVPNARFVAKYGYNFAFVTDSAANSHYSIARITVSK